MNKWILGIALGALSIGAFAQEPDTGAGAKAVVEAQAQKITQDLHDNAAKYAGNQQAFQNFIEQELGPRLDFDMAAKIALGWHVREVTAAGKFEAFRDEFKRLLIRVYSRSWQNYTNAKVRVLGTPTVDNYNRAQVRVQVTSNDGKTSNVIFAMYYTGGMWKLYDGTFENVSLLTSYRNTFDTELQNGSIDALIQKLKTMN